MESLQETFILEKLKNYNYHNPLRKYNLDELSSHLNILLNKRTHLKLFSGYAIRTIFSFLRRKLNILDLNVKMRDQCRCCLLQFFAVNQLSVRMK